MRIGKFTHNLQVLNQKGITVEKSIYIYFWKWCHLLKLFIILNINFKAQFVKYQEFHRTTYFHLSGFLHLTSAQFV